MLAKDHRIRRPAQFAALIRAGRRGASRWAVVYVQPTVGPWRAGTVVSKAVGNSVERHRVVRRLRAIAAARLPGIDPSLDVVVRALPGAAHATYAQLDDAVCRALAKALR
ncbi:MAG: ribonuclease P protein component [Bifidobacteriaceae bacterium]|nr:ribonuclease P protein component [Bifidobacteriaceae bacterium]